MAAFDCNVIYLKLLFFRLDAGTFGTMGVGTGFAIAASMIADRDAATEGKPARRVVCIQGDSAFGFSGMEVETAAR